MDEVVYIVVSGRVQGVGFRYFTDAVARRQGVAGWVRNLPGGKVEILARLAENKSAFLAELRRGPPSARVDGVETRPAPPGMECPRTGFSMRY